MRVAFCFFHGCSLTEGEIVRKLTCKKESIEQSKNHLQKPSMHPNGLVIDKR